MTDLEIYAQTQKLAQLLGMQHGFISGAAKDFTHMSSGRGGTFFKNACEIMEELFGHEMSDVIDSWEEENPDKCYAPLSDKEALIELGSGNSVWVRSASGNEHGYKEITDPQIFMDTCYMHCTVYKRGE